MTKLDDVNLNMSKKIKELVPKDIKITEDSVELVKNLIENLLLKISNECGLSFSNSSKHLLTQDDILKIIAKLGLNKYIIDLEEEINRVNKEELAWGHLSKS